MLCYSLYLPAVSFVNIALFFFFLWPHVQHVEVPGLGAELEPQLQASATATTTLDLSCICNLYHSLWQHPMLNPLSKARDRTHILTDPTLDS